MGLSFVYADYGDAKIRDRSPLTGLVGEYDRNDLFFVTFHVNWSRLPWGE